jgi:hypothetical protein
VVECAGTYTRGQTVVDWGCFDGKTAERPPNVNWVTKVNVSRYQQLMDAALDERGCTEMAAPTPPTTLAPTAPTTVLADPPASPP